MSPESTPDRNTETSFTPELAPVLTDPEVVNLAPIAFAITDVITGEFMYVNDRVRQIFGLGSSPASCFNISTLYSSLEVRAKLVEQLLTYGIVEAVEVPVRRSDGTLIWVLGSSKLIRYQGKLCALLAVADITVMKQLNDELETKQSELKRYLAMTEQLQLAAERESHSKSTLLVNLTHEIRTPLNGIIGMSQVLADETTDQNIKPLVDAILQSAIALNTLTSSILEHSQLTSGETEQHKSWVEPSCIIAKTIQYAVPRIGSKQLEVASVIDAEVPEMVEVDGDKLQQALTHLLCNSIKFTEQGDVIVRCGYGLDQLSISVSDTGVGIPQNKFDDIFNDFMQLDASATRKFGGIGLGLSIAKKAVACLGGQILVDSEEGVGSTFTIIVPAPSRAVKNSQPKSEDKGKAALYSQSEGMLSMLESTFKGAGYCCEQHPLSSWNDSRCLPDALTILDIPNSIEQTIAASSRFKHLSHAQKEKLIVLVHRNCAPPPAVIDSFSPIRVVVKPTDTQTLIETTIGKHLWNTLDVDLPDLGHGQGGVQPEEDTTVAYIPLASTFERNWSHVDGAFLRRITSMLVDTCNKCVEGIILGAERQDHAMVYTYAYQLHGSAVNAGAASTAQLCRRILDAAQAKNFEEVSNCASLIQPDLERFQESIERELGRKEA